MLETLDMVDWAHLTHAAGSAADVPGMIRQLLSPSASVRERALDERGLWGTLCHQDSVYEATAPAVPFLLELVREPKVRDRGKILDLLSDFAQGGYTNVTAEEERLRRETNLASDVRAEQERGVEWSRQTHAAVRAGLPTYLALLGDKGARVRVAALGVLEAGCKQDGERVASVLRERFGRERDRIQRAALARALPGFTSAAEETRAFLIQVSRDDKDALARLAAAVALATLDGERAPAGVEETLVRALVDPEPDVERVYSRGLGRLHPRPARRSAWHGSARHDPRPARAGRRACPAVRGTARGVAARRRRRD